MTDSINGSQASSTNKKLKSSTTTKTNDDLNSSTDEGSSNNIANTGSRNVVLLYPISGCSPEESVFLIDHIRESIFAKLDRNTLLKCRLVCHRWMHLSSQALQKIITFKCGSYKFLNAPRQQVLHYDGHRKRPIKDLISVMNTSLNFPCNSFSFKNGYSIKVEPLAQRFFSAHGPFLKILRFKGHVLLSDVKRLLLTQAPNLEQLFLEDVAFKYTETESRSNKSETKEEGRIRRESLFNETTTTGPEPAFKNLKKFSCDSARVPEMFQQQLLECSPNLVEVFLKLKLLHFLVKPVNRIHLLKYLEISLSTDSIESLEAVANSNQNHWAVKDIHFSGNFFKRQEDVLSRVGEAMGKILRSCSATCQSLVWERCFDDFHFQIPEMRGVKNFTLHYSTRTGLPVNIFPEGVSLGDTFPNLRSLQIISWKDINDFPIQNLFENNGSLWNGGYTSPLPNVRKVYLKVHLAENLLPKLREMFPNAEIETVV